VWDVHLHSAVANLRIGEYLGHVVDRRAGDTGGLERREIPHEMNAHKHS